MIELIVETIGREEEAGDLLIQSGVDATSAVECNVWWIWLYQRGLAETVLSQAGIEYQFGDSK